MFEDSLIESGNRFKAKRRLSTTILSFRAAGRPDLHSDPDSVDLHRCAAEGAADDLSGSSAASAASATPARGRSRKGREDTERMINGQLRTPTKIPKKIQMIKEEEAPPDLGGAGVPAAFRAEFREARRVA